MFPTVEVRWFCAGPIPSKVQTWFRRGDPPPEHQPERVDRYLRFGKAGAMGIKLREGRIEVKPRRAVHGTIRFGPRATGVVAHWHKWSFAVAEAELPAVDVRDADAWVAVRKARQMRYYRLEGGRVVALAPGRWEGESPGWDCEMELTQVHVEGTPWWTLGLEAVGDDPDTLIAVARHALASEDAPRLTSPASYGYAHWLTLLTPERP